MVVLAELRELHIFVISTLLRTMPWVARAGKCPVLWVRLDAGGDWLANTSVLQPDSMWAEQLETSKDVAAQVRSGTKGSHLGSHVASVLTACERRS